MLRRSFVLLAGTLALVGCVNPPPGGSGYPQAQREAPLSLGTPVPGTVPPSFGGGGPAGRGIAILAPLTGPNAERGLILVNAAKLALDVPGAPPLDVRDTGGTAEGAAQAATQAVAGGAGLIIGPLTAAETAGAARVTRGAGVALLAFTNDPAQAQPGVWTLGITPGQQVRRLVGASLAQNKPRIAALLPQSQFGQAMASALGQAISSAGAPTPDIRFYPPGGAQGAVSGLANYGGRIGPLMAQIRAARQRHDATGRAEAAELSRRDVAPPSFDALLLADTGASLSTITGLLQSYEVGLPAVRLMGPALWADPAARGGADLNGAWFAAPDPSARGQFVDAYQAKYGAPAPGLADVAYDAASIGRVLAQGGDFSVGSLCRPEGFAGADGLVALQADGTVRRGLALFEIQHGASQMVEPAPSSVSIPGI